jgi:uncharacterized protein
MWTPTGQRSDAPADRTAPHGAALTARECISLLASVEVGRVLLTVDALPSAVPVGHQVVDGAVVFRCIRETKMHAAVHGRVLGYEADDLGPAPGPGWSVLALGYARIVRDPAEIADLRRRRIRGWAHDGTSDFVRLAIDRITGRRFGLHPDSGCPSPSDTVSDPLSRAEFLDANR